MTQQDQTPTKMTLTPEDQAWLDAYRRELDQKFPGLVEQIILFGSKARGTATPDSDLDLLVVIKDGDWWLKRDVRRCGYRLAVATEVVPSIMVFTAAEWGSYAARRAPFYRTVSRDGASIS